MSYIRYKFSCLTCKSEISNNNYKNHLDSKQCVGTLKIRKTNICRFCNVLFKQPNHEAYCLENPNKLIRSGINQFTKAKLEGREIKVSALTREKLSKARTGKKHTEESLANIKRGMQRAVKENPNSYAGGYNRGRVKSLICSNGFKVLGEWERSFVEFCISNNIKILQPNIGFSYEWNGHRTYFPDFYLPETDQWIEIKGYETERDKAKWQSIIEVHNKNFRVVRQKEIKNLDKWWEQPDLN